MPRACDAGDHAHEAGQLLAFEGEAAGIDLGHGLQGPAEHIGARAILIEQRADQGHPDQVDLRVDGVGLVDVSDLGVFHRRARNLLDYPDQLVPCPAALQGHQTVDLEGPQRIDVVDPHDDHGGVDGLNAPERVFIGIVQDAHGAAPRVKSRKGPKAQTG